MSSARTHRLAALGTLCRRPAAVLTPLALIVLLVFAVLLLTATLRAAYDRRFATTQAEAEVAVPVVAAPVGPVARGLFAARPTPRRLLGGAAAMFGGILVAASMAGGTYAFLNAQATTPAVTVKSGNLAVTVQYGSTTAGTTTAIPATAWTGMLPGDFVGQQITVASTGSAKSTLTARLSALTAWDIRIVAGSCPTSQLTSTALTATAASLGSLAAGASTVYCVQATLPVGAAASVENSSAPFTILIDATQVPS